MSLGHYYSLRNSSFTVWQGLQAGLFPDNLLTYLTNAYEVDADTVREPLGNFLEQLAIEGLILEGTPTTVEALSAPVTRQSFTPLALEIYTDMADLLALDPIHDVSPVDGWPIKK